MEYNNFIGYVQINSGRLLISDPCYVKTEAAGVIEFEGAKEPYQNYTSMHVLEVEHTEPTEENPHINIWQATTVMSDDTGGWGMRVMKLRLARKGFTDFSDSRNRYGGFDYAEKNKVATVCVDSGQMMIADREAVNSWGEDEYTEPSKHAREMSYDGACNAASEFAGLIGGDDENKFDLAAVSRTGYGDGTYNVYTWTKGDRVIAVEINFDDEPEDEDEDDE